MVFTSMPESLEAVFVKTPISDKQIMKVGSLDSQSRSLEEYAMKVARVRRRLTKKTELLKMRLFNDARVRGRRLSANWDRDRLGAQVVGPEVMMSRTWFRDD